MVECLTRDQRAAGSSLTDVSALCPWARHINPCLIVVQLKDCDWNVKNQIKNKISCCFQVHSFAMVSGVRGEAGAPRKVSEAMSTTAAAMVTGVRGEACAPRKVSEAMSTTAGDRGQR